MPSYVIKYYHYYPETETLRITYQSGSVYDYYKVPPDIADRLKEAMSKGQFLNTYIKPFFRYNKIS